MRFGSTSPAEALAKAGILIIDFLWIVCKSQELDTPVPRFAAITPPNCKPACCT
jgi:hypothetical protein